MRSYVDLSNYPLKFADNSTHPLNSQKYKIHIMVLVSVSPLGPGGAKVWFSFYSYLLQWVGEKTN